MRQTIRVTLALVVSAAVPAIAVTIPYLLGRFEVYRGDDIHYAYESAARVWVLVFIIALLHAVMLGLPAYFWARKRGLIRWWMGVLGGFVIGCVPMAVITWPLWFSGLKTTASFDGVTTIVNGIPTYEGWLSYLTGVLYAGGYGILGGLAAWVVWRLTNNCCLKRAAKQTV